MSSAASSPRRHLREESHREKKPCKSGGRQSAESTRRQASFRDDQALAWSARPTHVGRSCSAKALAKSAPHPGPLPMSTWGEGERSHRGGGAAGGGGDGLVAGVDEADRGGLGDD